MNELSETKFIYRMVMKKVAAAKFISHLDLLDILKSAVRCAGIPYYSSKGFNPIMKISYPYPLPVGVSGQNEVFDLYLKENIPDVDLFQRINEHLMDGIRIIKVKQTDKKDPILNRGDMTAKFILTLLEYDEVVCEEECIQDLLTDVFEGDIIDNIDVKYFVGGVVRISIEIGISSKMKPQKFLSDLVMLKGRTYAIAAITRAGLIRDKLSLMD